MWPATKPFGALTGGDCRLKAPSAREMGAPGAADLPLYVVLKQTTPQFAEGRIMHAENPYSSPNSTPAASRANNSTNATTEEPSADVGVLAGLMIGPPAGILLVGLGSGWEPIAVRFGAAGGAVFGMMLGSLFGRFERVISGVAFGAIAPFLIMVIGAIRSRSAQPQEMIIDLFQPESVGILAGIAAAGALLGGLLTATAKGLRRIGRGSGA